MEEDGRNGGGGEKKGVEKKWSEDETQMHSYHLDLDMYVD